MRKPKQHQPGHLARGGGLGVQVDEKRKRAHREASAKANKSRLAWESVRAPVNPWDARKRAE